MNDIKTKISSLSKQNERILNELDFIEEILKTLAVNNLLSDAENLIKFNENTSKNTKETLPVKSNENEEKLKLEIQKLKEDYDLLNDKFNHIEGIFRKKIGSTCYICYGASEYYDENYQLQAFKDNTVLCDNQHNWDWNIIDYDFGMYKLEHHTKKNSYIIWISVANVFIKEIGGI